MIIGSLTTAATSPPLRFAVKLAYSDLKRREKNALGRKGLGLRRRRVLGLGFTLRLFFEPGPH